MYSYVLNIAFLYYYNYQQYQKYYLVGYCSLIDTLVVIKINESYEEEHIH